MATQSPNDRPAGRPNGRCQVCRSNDRSQIETLLACGATKISVARRFNLSFDTVDRHWRNHCWPSQRAARAAKALRPGVEIEKLINEESSGLLENLKGIRAKLHYLYDAAVEARDTRNAALIVTRLHENLRLVANLTGELIKHTTPNITNIMVNGDVVELMNAVRLAVAPYPEARKAIVTAFDRLEARAPKQFTSPASPPPLTIEGLAHVAGSGQAVSAGG